MNRQWWFEPEAFEEALRAVDYYDEQRDGLGAEFYDALERTLDLLLDEPFQATPHPWTSPELGLVRFRMRRFPYVLVLLPDAADVRVVAVAHVRREPLYWLPRVKAREHDD